MVEPRNRRGRARMWKGWKRWRGLYKSRWKEIKEKRSLSGLTQRKEELVCCSITGRLIVCCVSVRLVWAPSRGCVRVNERRLEAVRGPRQLMFCHGPCVCARSYLRVHVVVWAFQRADSHARVLTSKRWELTFLPFFIQVILGLGSPEAWHTNDATPPEMPVWSSGDLTKLGKPRRVRAKWAEQDGKWGEREQRGGERERRVWG